MIASGYIWLVTLQLFDRYSWNHIRLRNLDYIGDLTKLEYSALLINYRRILMFLFYFILQHIIIELCVLL